MKKFSRREFIKTGLFSTALLSSGMTLPGRAFASGPVCPGGASLRALVCIELLGGIDGFALSIPTDTARKNALIDRRTALTGYYDDPDLLHLGYGSNIAMHPAFKPLEDYIDNMRVTMELGNTMHVSPTGSHAIAQARMALGTSAQSTQNFGWKGRLYDSGANLIGFEGSRGQNFNCDICSPNPPLISRNYENYKLSGSTFHSTQGGAANSEHVANVIEELATMPLSRPTSQIEDDYRAAQQAMFSSIANVQNIVENYKTPLYDEYLVGGSAQNDLAIRFRNIAQTLLYLKCQGSSEKVVFVVPQGSYDVHGGHNSKMANLLSNLVFSLKVFIQDLEAMDLFNETVITTETDFGRQIRANGSSESNAGTDHGRGFTNLTLGGKVNGGANAVWGDMLSASQIETAHSWEPYVDSRALLAEIIEEHLKLDPEATAFPPPINGEFSRVAMSLFK